MIYVYKCPQHGSFEVVQKMDDATWTYECPACGLVVSRDLGTLTKGVLYNCDGFYHTDRKGVIGGGDKQDAIRKQYERATGEPAPPPASDVPRNGSEKY